jgi:hypothetical protein
MRVVVVTGGRNYENERAVDKTLSFLNPDLVLVGDAFGLDRLVRIWCVQNDTRYQVYNADWGLHGLAAGPIRNKKMLQDANKFDKVIVVGFPGGKGTKNCLNTAKQMGLLILEVKEEKGDG